MAAVCPWNYSCFVRFRHGIGFGVAVFLGRRFRQKEYGGVASLYVMLVTSHLITESSTPLDLTFVRRNHIRNPDPNDIILRASPARNWII